MKNYWVGMNNSKHKRSSTVIFYTSFFLLILITVILITINDIQNKFNLDCLKREKKFADRQLSIPTKDIVKKYMKEVSPKACSQLESTEKTLSKLERVELYSKLAVLAYQDDDRKAQRIFSEKTKELYTTLTQREERSEVAKATRFRIELMDKKQEQKKYEN